MLRTVKTLCSVLFLSWGHESSTQVTNQLHKLKSEIYPGRIYPIVVIKTIAHCSCSSSSVIRWEGCFFISSFSNTDISEALTMQRESWNDLKSSASSKFITEGKIAVLGSFGTCLCRLKQFKSVCITARKQVYLDIGYALSETVWKMPFGCMESNVCHSLSCWARRKIACHQCLCPALQKGEDRSKQKQTNKKTQKTHK